MEREAMAKTRAYTSQYGQEMISAAQVARIRNQRYNGRPTGTQYFSTHRPGSRKPVQHVMKKSCFFAYKEGTGNSGASGGESLNHILFKEALASLRQFELRLDHRSNGQRQFWMKADIQVTSSSWEKRIDRATGSPLFADVYIEFQDQHTAGLELKWEGLLYLEVRHTHAVEAAKQDALRALELPVIEVEIPDRFVYRTPDDQTSDEAEEAHRQRIKRIVESKSGFLNGTVLSNPSSKKFLVARNQALTVANRKMAANLKSATDQLQTLAERNQKVADQLRANQQSMQATEQNLGKSQLAQRRAAGDLIAAQTVISQLRKQRRLLVALCFLLSCGLTLASLL